MPKLHAWVGKLLKLHWPKVQFGLKEMLKYGLKQLHMMSLYTNCTPSEWWFFISLGRLYLVFFFFFQFLLFCYGIFYAYAYNQSYIKHRQKSNNIKPWAAGKTQTPREMKCQVSSIVNLWMRLPTGTFNFFTFSC